MAYIQNTMVIRREILARLTRLMKEDQLTENIDRIPLEMAPKEKGAQRRCCVHKERAVIKYKTMPLLGFSPDDENDELTPLSEYAGVALQREEASNNSTLTVVDEACTGCVKVNYVVSNLCRGCVARSCQMNCPKDAIIINAAGKAQIVEEDCISCGICHKACPYHAIIYVPVPCEEACPVGAIKKNEQGVEEIDEEKCILCGRCINACPFGSIFEISQVIDVLSHIKNGGKLTAMVAPALHGQYGVKPGQVINAIKEVGFAHVAEVAEGADMTAREEAAEFRERLEEGCSLMTTSCCPSYVEAVNKHIPAMKKLVSETPSPMIFSARLAKERFPDSKTVFIGPCVAKRKEAKDSGLVDYVLTFEELDAIFEGMGIDVRNMPEEADLVQVPREARGFAMSNGVTNAVKKAGEDVYIKEVVINGLDKKSLNMLKAYARGKAPGNFIEVMACEGGCLSGPCSIADDRKGKKQFNESVDSLYQ
ncbi:[FeFe] hydrogenase (group B1/B3) [Marinilabilia salmonicolor]|jgi:[FeFe] hydrogenase (group B1/B3)|uniref:monomeric [FeFe] hydrogenase n=1 Tax=Marinilabilia salmonicolor TaxID=989 RepID=UPI000D06A80C|nr:monomeric [FeFe] hydrogenase [Marinilabilia salmonicolor]PRY95913.1 [FeFe] hydrogenase (group B1/B3) [Marinilabilia salmonicolor]